VRAALILTLTSAALCFAPTADAGGSVIVGLGDSYSSGEANAVFDTGTDTGSDRCHRSFLSWQRLIGVAAGDQLSCSGAKISDLYSGQRTVAPDNTGQIARLRTIAGARHIDWVLLTMGGNDLDFASVMTSCFFGNCLQHIDTVEKPKLTALEPRLAQAFRDVATAAPGARVAVVGYPDIFPLPNRAARNCGWLTRAERPRLQRLADLLDGTLQRAARAAGITYIPVRDGLRGHELCTADSWMFPIGTVGGQQRAHPTVCGQVAIARRVGAVLGQRRAFYGCDQSTHLRVAMYGDPSADGFSVDTHIVGNRFVRRRGVTSLSVNTGTIFNPSPASVSTLHVYDDTHFSVDINQSGSASVDASRVWYVPSGKSAKQIARCDLRYGCRPLKKGVPTQLGTVRLLNVTGRPPPAPKRFAHFYEGSRTEVEMIKLRWRGWRSAKATSKAWMAFCDRAPCHGTFDPATVTASLLVLCPVRGAPRMVGYYHRLAYRRRDKLAEIWTTPQDDFAGNCRTLGA
jgi:hypothetical protein